MTEELWAVKVIADIRLDLQLGESGKSITTVTSEYLVTASSRNEADRKAEELLRVDIQRELKYNSWARVVKPNTGNDQWR